MNMQYFCAKDNCETDVEKGCRHPNDFCQHRTACFIYFLEKEEKKGRRDVVDAESPEPGPRQGQEDGQAE